MASKKKIAGITIEINGDTTKLDKALSATDKASKTTTDNLKEVERLLKLDPTNVELLAQKQDYLSQRVEQTSDRYQTLKEAMEQSTASNVKYDQWEKAQASLQGQITKTENELKGLETEQQRLIDLGFPVDSTDMVTLQEQIDATRQRSVDLRGEIEATYEALGRPISVDQYQYLQRELVSAELAMEDATKAANDFHPALEKVRAEAQQVSTDIGAAAEATKGLSATAAAGVTAMVGLAVSAGKTADDIATMAKQTGFSTETIQSWMYAADLIDVSVDDIVAASTRLKKNLGSNSADVQAAFESLGIRVRDVTTNEFLPMEQIFDQVIRTLAHIPDPVERDIMAMQLLGKNADQLAGLIDDGGKAFRGYAQEAKEAGLILSQDALEGANAFNDELDRLSAQARLSMLQFGASIAEALTPELNDLVGLISSVLQWITNLDTGVLKFALTFGFFMMTISPVLGFISNIGKAITSVGTIAEAFSAGGGNSLYFTFVKWSAIIMGVVMGISLLLMMIAALTGKADEVGKVANSMKGMTSGTGTGMGAGMGGYNMPTGFTDGGAFSSNSPMMESPTAGRMSLSQEEQEALFARADAAHQAYQTSTQVNVNFDGSLAQLGRVMDPVVTVEESRQGPSITPKR